MQDNDPITWTAIIGGSLAAFWGVVKTLIKSFFDAKGCKRYLKDLSNDMKAIKAIKDQFEILPAKHKKCILTIALK